LILCRASQVTIAQVGSQVSTNEATKSLSRHAAARPVRRDARRNVKSTRGEPLTKAHERRQSTDRGESSRLQCIMPRPLGRNPRRGRNSQERIERRQLNNMRPALRILRMPRVQKRQRDQTASAEVGLAEESAPVCQLSGADSTPRRERLDRRVGQPSRLQADRVFDRAFARDVVHVVCLQKT